MQYLHSGRSHAKSNFAQAGTDYAVYLVKYLYVHIGGRPVKIQTQTHWSLIDRPAVCMIVQQYSSDAFFLTSLPFLNEKFPCFFKKILFPFLYFVKFLKSEVA